MSSEARLAANRQNAQASTGPRTEDGKARSSQNAAALGLFSARAFVRPEEIAEYDALRAGLMAELAPASLMEQAHVTEILNSMWRLRRCSLVEASLAELDASPDPMNSPGTLPTQNAIDRARAHAGNTLRRSTTELRRLQTERMLQKELGPAEGLASHKEASPTLIADARRNLMLRKLNGLETLESILRAAEKRDLENLTGKLTETGLRHPGPNRETAITKRTQLDPTRIAPPHPIPPFTKPPDAAFLTAHAHLR
jgi:hypothetical protein